ncbi:DNA-3-methyladenine glycosylase 2 family protein [Dictyobacter arantiisoli]|uniref:DNA-3-methyladenine glycosylase II n=1 Tax=Dictyobacter arantiisoli TaxID=2014874 RepID=A0A5A5T8T1_9CHLR|nr:DNA-3-methyladenine glycosylase 2 [Dictyobacter arantiisoli]GCF07576.1 DNA-3-methyladenine glycosylase [Dictyobacter arantiisoli]
METASTIHTDFDLCYRALLSRDARFDGRFFTAVTTTGIYCRPICPATTPLEQHVRFYACAAAAEAAGFRACRRCHPEASPGSPDWNVRADLVARALHLIADGVVNTEGVRGLAQRLSVSERHIHRELVAEVGVGPLALARSRRAQTARLLLDQTSLSLTTIAFSAGFNSIRQFNESMQAAFGCAPSELRQRTCPANNGDGKLTLRLHYRPPLALDPLLAYLERRALPGIEEVSAGCYRRTVAFQRSRGIIEIEPIAGKNALLVHLQLNDLSELGLIVQRCRQLFDLDADPAAIADILGADPLLASLVEAQPGLRIPGAINGFELALRAILGQQVSIAGARTLCARMVTRCGEKISEPQGSLTHFFPTPEQILAADLQGLGLTQARIQAIQALARAVVTEGLGLERDAERERTNAQLLSLPGIGPWTASYIAMRALGDPNALPATDLGLRHAFEAHGLKTDARSILSYAEKWRPWRAYATHYLWNTL